MENVLTFNSLRTLYLVLNRVGRDLTYRGLQRVDPSLKIGLDT